MKERERERKGGRESERRSEWRGEREGGIDGGREGEGRREGERRGNGELTFFNVLFTEVSSEVSWTDTDNGLCTAHTSIHTGTCWKRKRGREGEGGKERDERFGFNQTHVIYISVQTNSAMSLNRTPLGRNNVTWIVRSSFQGLLRTQMRHFRLFLEVSSVYRGAPLSDWVTLVLCDIMLVSLVRERVWLARLFVCTQQSSPPAGQPSLHSLPHSPSVFSTAAALATNTGLQFGSSNFTLYQLQEGLHPRMPAILI